MDSKFKHEKCNHESSRRKRGKTPLSHQSVKDLTMNWKSSLSTDKPDYMKISVGQNIP